MSGLKYLVAVLFVANVCTYPHNRRHVRSLNLQVQQPSYSYPYQYPYQSYQPGYGLPNLQMGPSQSYPHQQSNPWGVAMPSYPSYGSGYPSYGSGYPSYGSGYPSYGSGYPSYPSYPSYPLYPSYPHQPNFQSQPDPYAHIPTEIIDVDSDGNFDLGYPLTQFPTSNMPCYPGLTCGSQVPELLNGSLNDTLRQVHTETVESKPFTATVTRVFGSKSSNPTVDVTYSSPDSKPGSGVLIEATRIGGDVTQHKDKSVNEEDGTDNQTNDSDEKKTKDDEEEEEKAETSFWG